MVAVFLFITMYTEVVFFVIEHMGLMVNAIGTNEMQELNKPYMVKAQMASIFALFNYPIFFHGKELWAWITKRDKVVQKYEEIYFKKSSC